MSKPGSGKWRSLAVWSALSILFSGAAVFGGVWTYGVNVNYLVGDEPKWQLVQGHVTADDERGARDAAINEAKSGFERPLSATLMYVLPLNANDEPKKGSEPTPDRKKCEPKPEEKAVDWANPPIPEDLVVRWHVLPGRNPGLDNRVVNLLPGQTARIVVHLPECARSRFHFNLKHDKHNATDRGRTPQIGDGAIVSGDAHDWRAFGNRIYVGQRSGAEAGFASVPTGFYVDLVLVKPEESAVEVSAGLRPSREAPQSAIRDAWFGDEKGPRQTPRQSQSSDTPKPLPDPLPPPSTQ